MGGACSRRRHMGCGPEDSMPTPRPKDGMGQWEGEAGVVRSKCVHSRHYLEQRARPRLQRSLMELSVQEICDGMKSQKSLASLPKDLSQLIFNELVKSRMLEFSMLAAFRGCFIEDVFLAAYPGVTDEWLSFVDTPMARQALLGVDLSHCIEITDDGLALFAETMNMQTVLLNNCFKLSDAGIFHLQGICALP
eukprot:TRINITY_DN1435_c0_g1_i1.p1 TRINITY_DN1435_c0_g1~~TRINITY_DN1435_c0_g1_i1.p1  ORF type:complete len:193 (+),score=27.59 TRINITY_DN1435_c0_g1_i1:290-868(+)